VEVQDATVAGKAAASSARKAVLKHQVVGRGPGDSTIRLALTAYGKRLLRERGVMKTRPAITFTPLPGDSNTLRPKLKIKASK
jgi:hypothetical protein